MTFKLMLRNFVGGPLTEAAPPVDDAALAELAAQVNQASRARLGRTLSIREVDAGSCNGCELEIHALNNVLYDLERFGLRFVASPRHADVLLVTGPVTGFRISDSNTSLRIVDALEVVPRIGAVERLVA